MLWLNAACFISGSPFEFWPYVTTQQLFCFLFQDDEDQDDDDDSSDTDDDDDDDDDDIDTDPLIEELENNDDPENEDRVNSPTDEEVPDLHLVHWQIQKSLVVSQWFVDFTLKESSVKFL